MSDNPLLEAALSYARRGWKVIPLHTPGPGGCSCGTKCKSPGKHPRTEHGLKNATTDMQTVRLWWSRWPDANIGVVTGRESGIIVLDCDGEEGQASLQGRHTPLTACARTGVGCHYYYTHPGGVCKNFVRKEPGLDLRGDGGYVVAPPSLHPSGERYAWAPGLTPEEAGIAPAPAWLVDLIEKNKEEEKGFKGAPEWVSELMRGVEEGQRNNACARLAGYFLTKGLGRGEVETILLAWNQLNKPPLPAKEVRITVASIARAEQEKQSDRNFEVEKIEKLETAPPIYRVHIFGQAVKMDADGLTSWTKFKRLVMQATNRLPSMRQPTKNWEPYLADVLETRLEIIPAPQEASQEAIWWDMIQRYLYQKSEPDEAAVAEMRGVYRNDQFVYVHGPSLYRHLRQRQQAIEPRELWDLLKERGAEPVWKRFQDSEGNLRGMRVWRIPLPEHESISRDDLPEEEEPG